VALPPGDVTNSCIVLDDISGNTFELAVQIDCGDASRVGLKVCCSSDGKEETGIWYDAVRGRLIVDMTWSTLRDDVTYNIGPIGIYSLDSHTHNKQATNTVDLREGETLKLRVFLDGPILEVFANDRECVTQQIFPALPESRGVKLCARGGTARLVTGNAWHLAPAEFVNHKSG
jgi:beta-fructofuranosidase